MVKLSWLAWKPSRGLVKHTREWAMKAWLWVLCLMPGPACVGCYPAVLPGHHKLCNFTCPCPSSMRFLPWSQLLGPGPLKLWRISHVLKLGVFSIWFQPWASYQIQWCTGDIRLLKIINSRPSTSLHSSEICLHSSSEFGWYQVLVQKSYSVTSIIVFLKPSHKVDVDQVDCWWVLWRPSVYQHRFPNLDLINEWKLPIQAAFYQHIMRMSISRNLPAISIFSSKPWV